MSPPPADRERLHKVLAAAGVASRRASEKLIQEGRVKVNREVVLRLGTRVDPRKDQIAVDGKLIAQKPKPVYLLLFKPKGVLTTVSDPRGRKTVRDLIPDIRERVYPVGRLDRETAGLLILTNDGELAHRLMHPSSKVPRTYIARVKGLPAEPQLEQLARGVPLAEGVTAPAEIEIIEIGPDWMRLKITLIEGWNREVRRMLAKIGHPVITLKRTAYGPLTLKGLGPGKYRLLRPAEIRALRRTFKG